MCGIRPLIECTHAAEVEEGLALLPLDAAVVLAGPEAEAEELPDAVWEARLPVKLSVTPY